VKGELYYYVNLVFKLVICFTNNKLSIEKRMREILEDDLDRSAI
jgi:hypothetical protein